MGVEELKNQIHLQEELREALNQIYDIERLITRISLGVSNGREMLSLKVSFQMVKPVQQSLAESQSTLLQTLNDALVEAAQVIDPPANLIEEAIHPEPPNTITEGNLIKGGYNAEVDELRQMTISGKDWIAELQQRERDRTGITSLKVGFNQVFGYYIDVTKTNLDLVPEDYIRKQTLVNSERYVT